MIKYVVSAGKTINHYV